MGPAMVPQVGDGMEAIVGYNEQRDRIKTQGVLCSRHLASAAVQHFTGTPRTTKWLVIGLMSLSINTLQGVWRWSRVRNDHVLYMYDTAHRLAFKCFCWGVSTL